MGHMGQQQVDRRLLSDWLDVVSSDWLTKNSCSEAVILSPKPSTLKPHVGADEPRFARGIRNLAFPAHQETGKFSTPSLHPKRPKQSAWAGYTPGLPH